MSFQLDLKRLALASPGFILQHRMNKPFDSLLLVGLLASLAACQPTALPEGKPSSLAREAQPSSAAVQSERSASASPARPVEHPVSSSEENDPALHEALREIANGYAGFTRADGSWWSPLDCMAPPADQAKRSLAPESSPHGRKIYTLHILDFDGYVKETQTAVGQDRGRVQLGDRLTGATQAIVKASFAPTSHQAEARSGIRPVEAEDGTVTYAGAPRDLFIMYKPKLGSRTTDQGWLYGTVTADGKTVTSAGLVGSCMGCHEKAPHGRLFGASK